MSETLLADRDLGRRDYEAIMGHRFAMGMKYYAKGKSKPQRAALERAAKRMAVRNEALQASDPETDNHGQACCMSTGKPDTKRGHNRLPALLVSHPHHRPLSILTKHSPLRCTHESQNCNSPADSGARSFGARWSTSCPQTTASSPSCST